VRAAAVADGSTTSLAAFQVSLCARGGGRGGGRGGEGGGGGARRAAAPVLSHEPMCILSLCAY
jgi:hypothetical protein